jgi:hypothetical protein
MIGMKMTDCDAVDIFVIKAGNCQLSHGSRTYVQQKELILNEQCD